MDACRSKAPFNFHPLPCEDRIPLFSEVHHRESEGGVKVGRRKQRGMYTSTLVHQHDFLKSGELRGDDMAISHKDE